MVGLIFVATVIGLGPTCATAVLVNALRKGYMPLRSGQRILRATEPVSFWLGFTLCGMLLIVNGYPFTKMLVWVTEIARGH